MIIEAPGKQNTAQLNVQIHAPDSIPCDDMVLLLSSRSSVGSARPRFLPFLLQKQYTSSAMPSSTAAPIPKAAPTITPMLEEDCESLELDGTGWEVIFAGTGGAPIVDTVDGLMAALG